MNHHPHQQPGILDKIAATFGLLAGVAALVLAGCLIYFFVTVLF